MRERGNGTHAMYTVLEIILICPSGKKSQSRVPSTSMALTRSDSNRHSIKYP